MRTGGRDERLSPSRRVRKRQDFLRIQGSGRKIRTYNLLVILADRPEGEECRIGITTTKKVDKRAARRNRFKRRVREFFRKERRKLRRSVDIVVIALDGACELKSPEVAFQLRFALRKGGLLGDKRPTPRAGERPAGETSDD